MSGSTVIGPTPEIMFRSSRKLLPTIFPSSSATTPWNPEFPSIPRTTPVATSAFGKSGGKLCAFAIAVKAA
jgi:hypothetical protein